MGSLTFILICIVLVVGVVWSPGLDFIDKTPVIWYNGLDERKNKVRKYFKFW
jgi:hypothetical protein